MKKAFLLALIFGLSYLTQAQSITSVQSGVDNFLDSLVNRSYFSQLTGYHKKQSDIVRLDSINISTKDKLVSIYLSSNFAYAPFRQETVDSLKAKIYQFLPAGLSDFYINIYTEGIEISQLIPDYFRKGDIDTNRINTAFSRQTVPLVQNISTPICEKRVLNNIYLAMWHSHGWYYEPKLDRWEWQRARLFNTVEDLYTMSYTMNYIVPMLENAGAGVLLPRERSIQANEVVVDNDGSSRASIFKKYSKAKAVKDGFANSKNGVITNENPFRQGSYLLFNKKTDKKVLAEWIPDIPERGEYPVYVSYHTLHSSPDSVVYEVHHSGGVTRFAVNQQMGGGTWIYLGSFIFEKGVNKTSGKVVLTGGDYLLEKTVTADAVRFGGGMGSISRKGKISDRPRYQEAARYYLQYAGFPDSLVWKIDRKNEDDYKDDLRARGEWVNYLKGLPINGADTAYGGLDIPVDMTIAVHTDAGITDNDSVIGTLGIYCTKHGVESFPDGVSKIASRYLLDIVQSQIVADLRTKYDTDWVRRGMLNKEYSEVYRPQTPSVIIELLSHQNFADVRFGKEPQFQFDMGRAVYKGILKFFSVYYGTRYIVQPLPVDNFGVTINDDGSFSLSWSAVADPLEPTATPDGYIVYTKTDSGGYDNGVFVDDTFFVYRSPAKDAIYSFKIEAVNAGGRSFSSEELSACVATNSKGTVLIVNAFDRTGGAAFFDDTARAGFLTILDAGVPYRYDFHTTGEQYDFDKKSLWLDDDSPGFGASFADLESQIIKGNTFDFSYVHGLSIKRAGYSFCSVSDEYFTGEEFSPSRYFTVDFLCGEERSSYLPGDDTTKRFEIFTPATLNTLANYLAKDGNVFVSGAYIATDAHSNGTDKDVATLLKYKWRTDHAARKGGVSVVKTPFSQSIVKLEYNAKPSARFYQVESPDALEPASKKVFTFVRYSENNMSAGVAYRDKYGVVATGFPFETIVSQQQRDKLMERILNFFEK